MNLDSYVHIFFIYECMHTLFVRAFVGLFIIYLFIYLFNVNDLYRKSDIFFLRTTAAKLNR